MINDFGFIRMDVFGRFEGKMKCSGKTKGTAFVNVLNGRGYSHESPHSR